MDIQRTAILVAMAVTAYLLVLAWNEDYGPDSQREVATESTPAVVSPASEMPLESPFPDAPADITADEIPTAPAAGGAETATVPVAGSNSRTIRIESDTLILTIDLKGGDIVEVSLPQFPASLDSDVPLTLLDPAHQYSAQTGLIGPDGPDRTVGRPVYTVDANAYSLADGADTLTVPLRYVTPDGVELTKRFTLRRDAYVIDITYDVVNHSTAPFEVAMFAQIRRDGRKPEQGGQRIGLQPYVGGAVSTEDALYEKIEFDDLEEGPWRQRREGGYVSMVQHHFVSAFVPAYEGISDYQARKLQNRDLYLMGFTSPLWQVAVGGEESKSVKFYAGPKHQYRLREVAPGLDLTVDYGFLWFIAQPLFYLLDFLHDYVQNWGLAIILLTLLVKTALFPLSAAGFRSVAKMRKLQPEMARLKERYGDDRQKFSEGMMELYKKEGANPLGGCFPLLLQMPVFIALYWSLMESVELRHAPFFLWINDLSAMDPYFILPILMGASMFLTQMMQPEPPDPIQAKVFKIMPIMFTFFFLWFPSGLVLYWFINNCLSILQQYYVTKKYERETAKT